MNDLVLRRYLGAVAMLELNRPETLNALSPGLLVALRAHVEALAAETDRIRAVVLCGAGRSFCAVADLEALRAGVVTEDPEFR